MGNSRCMTCKSQQDAGGPRGGGLPADAPRGAWVEIKVIKNHRYLYMRWRENERTRSRYLGRAADDR